MKVTQAGDVITFTHEFGSAKGTLLPNCSNVIYLHESSVQHDYRGKGLGKKYHEERLVWIKQQGYIMDAFCLVLDHNEAENKILLRNGWTVIRFPISEYFTLWHRKIQ